MSVINITNIEVLNNPAKFDTPFAFDITFECISALKEDLEWKIVYVGSAESEQYDQVLDCIMVGPVPVGVNKFVFQADAPNPTLIPPGEILGVTIVLLICSYNAQEFVRVGYYVNVEYDDEQLRLEPPENVLLDRLQRNILSEKPRVTRFAIKWDNIELPEESKPENEVEEEEEEDMALEQANDSFVKDNLMELAYS